MALFYELKRRNVFRVGSAYLASGWLGFEILVAVTEFANAPDWIIKIFATLLISGFPVALMFSWAYELTAEGLKKTAEVDASSSISHSTGHRLNQITIVIIVLAVLVLVADRSGWLPTASQSSSSSAQADIDAPAVQNPTPAEQAFSPNSIAVLPFADMSPAGDQEYFSDGLSEELLNLLAKIPDMQVAARTSSFSYKGKDAKIEEIAKELRVAHVLEGSVRKAGNQIRITAQLIQAKDGFHLWSQTYNRELADVFAIQDEIAAAVVEELKVTMLGEVPQAQETNPQAYAMFLQARHFAERNSEQGLAQAETLLQETLRKDPSYVPAWNLLARIHMNMADLGLRPFDEGYAQAREAANQVLALDPDNAYIHSLLAWIAATYDLDIVAAADYYERALALDPKDLRIIGNAASLLVDLNRLDEAIKLEEYQAARDPISPVVHGNLGASYFLAGRYADTISAYETALRLSPDYAYAQHIVGLALLNMERPQEALEKFQQEPDELARLEGLAMSYHSLGETQKAEEALTTLIQTYGEEWPSSIARVFAWRLEKNKSFEWLEESLKQQDGGLGNVDQDPAYTVLRDDPRWADLLERIGRSPEQLSGIEFNITLPDATGNDM